MEVTNASCTGSAYNTTHSFSLNSPFRLMEIENFIYVSIIFKLNAALAKCL